MTESKKECPPWSATVIDTLTHNPYFSVLLQDVTVTDGGKREYFTIHFPTPSVGIVARRGTDILLLRQYRFIIGQYVWAIPSGGVRADEDPRAAAMRELEEETGYAALSLSPLLTCYASYGCSDQRFEIYLAEDLRKTSDTFDHNEVIGVHWFSRNELLGLIDRNEIVDNLSLSPILRVLLQDEHTERAGVVDVQGA